MIYRIATLIRKELQALLQDRQSRALLVGPVVLQLAIFPFAATLELKNNTLAVFNQDAGASSIELIQRLARAQAFTRMIYLHTERELQQAIDTQQALVVLRFPQDFSRRLAAGNAVTLQAVLDGRRSNGGQIALGYVRQIVQDYLDNNNKSSGAQPRSKILVSHWFYSNLHYV